MKTEPYKYIPHGPWVPLKGAGKTYCVGCGLVRLNNAFTRWAIDKGCNNEDHPQHNLHRKKTNTLNRR